MWSIRSVKNIISRNKSVEMNSFTYTYTSRFKKILRWSNKVDKSPVVGT